MKYILMITVLIASIEAFSKTLDSYFKNEGSAKIKTSVFTKTNFFVGHSLTQTSYTLPKGKWMMGSFALGYGITDDVTLGTSPWLVTLYNMPNVILRTKKSLSTSAAVGLQLGYMKTQNYLRSLYEMETFYGNLIFSQVFHRNLRSHFQVNAMYFRNDEVPFSIRVQNSTTPLQLSLSNVNEITAYKKKNTEFGFGLELGVLALNEELPYFHGGVSIYRKVKNLFLQVGLSLSASDNISVSDLGYVGQSSLPEGSEDFREIVTHPEIQVQYYF